MRPKSNTQVYTVNDISHHESIIKLGRALSSSDRLKVFDLLQQKPLHLIEIAKTLDLPVSSVSKHIDILADAGLISINYYPGPKGHLKVCSKRMISSTILYNDYNESSPEEYTVEMPVGQFTEISASPSCGMASREHMIGSANLPSQFFIPERQDAELLWFNDGYIVYQFPNSNKQRSFSELRLSLECCSEISYYRNDWPSDVTLSINDTELLTFTMQGDFGGRRGNYSPSFWPLTSTQFGMLEKFTVDGLGVHHNGKLVNKNVLFQDLHVAEHDTIELKLEIKKDAQHKGGINIFGKHFGDYPQGIILLLK